MKFKDTKYGDLTGKHYKGSIKVKELGLTSLEGAPESVGLDFDCSMNELSSLEFCPKTIGRDFYCQDNNITSLEGMPEYIDGFFYCEDNLLTSLKGCAKSVGKYFDCSRNRLTTLVGGPSSVGKGYNCEGNKLTTLEGVIEAHVSGVFEANGNPNPHLEKEYKLRKANAEMSEKEIMKEMYKITKDKHYMPDAIKKIFLQK